MKVCRVLFLLNYLFKWPMFKTCKLVFDDITTLNIQLS